VACLVKRRGEVLVVHGGPELPGEADGGWAGPEVLIALGEEFFGGSGLPAQPDPQLVRIAGWHEGDVAEEGAQQPFAVLVAGGGRVPQAGQACCGFGELAGFGERGLFAEQGGQGGLGAGQLGEPRFPAGFEGTGDEAVLRFAGEECPLGAVCLVAGALGGEFGGAGGAVVAGGDLAGGGDGQLEFVGFDGGEQGPGDGVVDGGGAGVLAVRGGLLVGAGAAGVVGAAVVVVHAHVPAAAAVDDALA